MLDENTGESVKISSRDILKILSNPSEIKDATQEIDLDTIESASSIPLPIERIQGIPLAKITGRQKKKTT